MPLATREAMLQGIAVNDIIVGAYVDNKTGGICPMLAAHRCGGRTNLSTFATAWDQFTGANVKKPRPASRQEIRALRGYLERSLIGAEVSDEPLAGAVREVQASRRRLAETEAQEDADVTVEQVLEEVGSSEIRKRAAAESEERAERLAREFSEELDSFEARN
jgi:hypothetical protein